MNQVLWCLGWRLQSGDVEQAGDNLGLELRKTVRLGTLIWESRPTGGRGSHGNAVEKSLQENVQREEMSE